MTKTARLGRGIFSSALSRTARVCFDCSSSSALSALSRSSTVANATSSLVLAPVSGEHPEHQAEQIGTQGPLWVVVLPGTTQRDEHLLRQIFDFRWARTKPLQRAEDVRHLSPERVQDGVLPGHLRRKRRGENAGDCPSLLYWPGRGGFVRKIAPINQRQSCPPPVEPSTRPCRSTRHSTATASPTRPHGPRTPSDRSSLLPPSRAPTWPKCPQAVLGLSTFSPAARIQVIRPVRHAIRKDACPHPAKLAPKELTTTRAPVGLA